MCYMTNAPQGQRPIPQKDANSNCFSIDQQVNLFCECGYHYFVLKKKSNCKKAGGFARHGLSLIGH